jgi:hypothetical protein
MTATAAHIHEGASGSNGPVIVPFTKTSDNTFEAPAGASSPTRSARATRQAGPTSTCTARRTRRRDPRAVEGQLIA